MSMILREILLVASARARLGCLALGLIAQLSWAQLPTNVTVKPFLQSASGRTISKPVFFAEFPNLPNHYLILEQHLGAASVFKMVDGAWVKEQFLKLAVQTSNEMGLLGFAFHPDFAENRKYYVVHNPSGSALATLLEERVADATYLKDSGNPPRLLLRIDKTHTNHNGGTIAFGKDGFLYFGTGDGFDGPGSDKTKSFLGTILRIDVDNPANGKPYGIPSDNPYASSTDAAVKKEIWAIGLRNPWKWSIDPLNGDFWAGEVGDEIEEVDLIRKGENLGWATVQGTTCYGGGTACNTAGLTPPVAVLPRNDAQSVIGGPVFRAKVNSSLYGAFIFGDYYTRKIWALTHENRVLEERVQIALSPSDISSFGTDVEGNIYVVGHNDGKIYILDHPDLSSPVRAHPGKPGRQGIIRGTPSGAFLDAQGLADAEAVEIFSPDGAKSWSWEGGAGAAPSGPLRRGLNIVRVRYPDGSQDKVLLRLP